MRLEKIVKLKSAQIQGMWIKLIADKTNNSLCYQEHRLWGVFPGHMTLAMQCWSALWQI